MVKYSALDTVDCYDTELLNFNFNQPERTQSLYYKPERRSGPFQALPNGKNLVTKGV